MTQPLAVLDVELTEAPETIAVPAGYAGASVVIRRNGRLAGLYQCGSRGGIPRAELESVAAPGEPCAPPARATGRPTLSIAVCTRNRPDVLGRCLRSILEVCGNAPNVEVLVVDNVPSSDANRRTVSRFPGVRYVIDPRAGLSFARNRAIDASSGQYIAYIDDDAVLDRGWLNGFLEAYAQHPEAAAFSGPILPYELETEAQTLVEGRGGLGHSFRKIVYSDTLPGSPLYPCGEACIGTGANMVFRRDVLEKLGRFDEAIGPGMPSQCSDDHDLFYRLIRAGYRSVYEPQLAIFHQHRREMAQLRRQVRSWAVGTVAYMLKAYAAEPEQRWKIRRFLVRLGIRKTGGVAASLLGLRRYRWPVSLAWQEFCGYVQGFTGVYGRSLRAAEERRRAHPEVSEKHETATVL